MTYAIVETGGKQMRVEPGRFYDIELLHAEADENYTIDKVLLVSHDGEITVGQPLVEAATVEGTIMRHFRGRKIIVYKMKPKKKTRKKRGHRQEITRLMINSISVNGTVLAAADTPSTTATATEEPTVEVESTTEEE
ncbi:50S ribosomal protein L21 [Lusitaniella coriacea LEGE 07157]|uniref:Large ribosomal subunit protein bL21 n=1 Tax=Lusitaniella coriacea LEGE 07157 TaxID=945747 RepID=A0A8J7DU96_9CYAN|nr:50S ribosomal protein L21 [Lusitaniella coriacea]MBE9115491.1 50S ribosomal protein L21 [Lusitaniella coriacea LEGE 07157]